MAVIARLQKLCGVLGGAWPNWLALSGAGGALALGWCLAPTSQATIRYAGMILQLLGLATVAFGLSQMRRLFGRPSLAARLADWFARLASVFRRPRSVNAHLHAGVGGITMGGKARLSCGAGPETPIERRVAILEENLNFLQQQVNEEVSDLSGRIAGLKAQMERETGERQDEDQRTARKLEEVAVGGLHLEEVGLLWLALGVVGTSVPDELAAWLARLV